jgi:hypothetical protein
LVILATKFGGISDAASAPASLANTWVDVSIRHIAVVSTASYFLVWLKSDGTYQDITHSFFDAINTTSRPPQSGTYTYEVSSTHDNQATLTLSPSQVGPIVFVFTTSASGLVGGDPSSPFTVFSAVPDSGAINVSNRCWLTPQRTAITGFVLGGTMQRWVLLRAAGPGLVAHGVPVVVAEPQLTLYRPGGATTTHGSWSADANLATGFQTVFALSGAFAFAPGSADAAALVLLPPGLYTMHGGGATTEAEVLLEAYILEFAAPLPSS